MIKSSTGNFWNLKSEESLHSRNILKVLLKNRDKNIDFLAASLRTSTPEPLIFKDMSKAVNRIYRAITEKQPIAILGDYDVDGICSTCILLKFFEEIGVQCSYHIPSRIDEGYGFSSENIDKYKDNLIIAVDCGSSAIDELQYAQGAGVDVIVLDHHKMTEIPKTYALVNAHRPDESGDFQYLCATGIVFLCVVALNRLLREKGFYQDRQEVAVRDYLDLVALATVCDVVELVELNRAFVISGLEVIKQRKNIGIKALLSLSKSDVIDTSAVAFFIGPHLNAAGRIKTADIGVKLLMTQDEQEAIQLANELSELNKTRKRIETEIIDKVAEQIDPSHKFICMFNRSWHLGVIGIVAGRLKDKYNRPAILIAEGFDGICRGSCRSVESLDISMVIKKAVQAGLLINGGGHTMAAGFSIEIDKIPSFINFLEENFEFECSPKTLIADGKIDMENISSVLFREIEKVAPFGEGNRYPQFVFSDVVIISAKVVSEQHVSVIVKDKKGRTMSGICFKSVDTLLGNILMQCRERMDILGEFYISSWKGHRTLGIQIKDVALKHQFK